MESENSPIWFSIGKLTVAGPFDRHYLVIPVEHIATVKDLRRRAEDYSLGKKDPNESDYYVVKTLQSVISNFSLSYVSYG